MDCYLLTSVISSSVSNSKFKDPHYIHNIYIHTQKKEEEKSTKHVLRVGLPLNSGFIYPNQPITHDSVNIIYGCRLDQVVPSDNNIFELFEMKIWWINARIESPKLNHCAV